MDFRSLLVGTERGAALAVVVTFLAVGAALLARPPLEPPYDPATVRYWAVVALYAAPAFLVSAYGGGLLVAWVSEGTPAAVLWWLGTELAGPFLFYPTTTDRALATLQIAAVAGIAIGTLGFLAGRAAGAVWARGVRPAAGGGA